MVCRWTRASDYEGKPKNGENDYGRVLRQCPGRTAIQGR
jgi:hypothetical protein